MANIRKSFNFRNGVQVDNDNFIVNANGLVGIGTSTPTESLDLIGNAQISGLTTTTNLGVAQTSNFYGDVKVGAVNIDPSSGIITATQFVGDASLLHEDIGYKCFTSMETSLENAWKWQKYINENNN